jgi:hypothetical protein
VVVIELLIYVLVCAIGLAAIVDGLRSLGDTE